MNKIGLIILAAALSVLCFIADRHILSGDPGSALYKRAESRDNYDYSYGSSSFSYSDAEGLTAEEFDELYGDEYTLMYWASEYSDTVPEGRLTRVENAWGFFQGQQHDGRTVLNAYWSKGKAPEGTVCDFRNLVDCDEYFAQFGDEAPMHDGRYLVSHNEFYMADGQLCTVDITSSYLEDDYLMSNGGEPIPGQPPLDLRKPVFDGEKHEYISLELGGGVVTPCAYYSNHGGALAYIYNGHFSLLLDDYNGDGNPDYITRTCDPGSSGSYYYMQCMTPAGRANSQSLPSPHRNADSSFYVYGENAPSIRLNRIDRETVFYLTKDEDEIYPVILNSDLYSVSDSFSVDGKLYSSFYENGELFLKCTCLDIPQGYSTQDETARLSLRKLNDRMWEETDFSDETSFRLRSYSDDEVKLEIPLEKGVYRMEIYPESGGTAVTEFTVR
ncbi:MAG: hypothetical protein K2K44_13420 [Oscillospiraceae bacterium]|nr:hypothetical protein [Oscillospiraceae bacterium]